MNVRIVSPVYSCECNSAMMFLDMVDSGQRRRMVCTNPKCAHHRIVVTEPLFYAVPDLVEARLPQDRGYGPNTTQAAVGGIGTIETDCCPTCHGSGRVPS
jgi:hypothetical protein